MTAPSAPPSTTASTTASTTCADAVAARGSSFRDEITRFVADHQLPGAAVGVVLDADLVWSTGVGFADLERETPMTIDSVCQIASITKTFTATAIMQLRDLGVLQLDDPLVTYVPEVASATNPFGPIEQITIERLLRHSSGLQGEVPNDDLREWTQLDQADMIASLDRVEVIVRPGTVFRYSNLGFRLLAEVVHRLAGERWPAYVQRAMLDPLGMISSATVPTGDAVARMAQGYGPLGFAGRRLSVPASRTEYSEGDGDLWSTVTDLARWASQQFRIAADATAGVGQVLAGSTLTEMHRPTLVADTGWSSARGLGWGATRRKQDLTLVCHGGLLDGYNSHLCFSPTHRLAIIVLLNARPRGSAADLAWSLAEQAVGAIDAARPTSAPVVPGPPPQHLVGFLGRYIDEHDGDEARIEYLNGALACLSADRTSIVPMVATDDPMVFRFFEEGTADRYVTFWRDGAGEGVDGVNFDGAKIGGVNIGGYPFVRLHLPGPGRVA